MPARSERITIVPAEGGLCLSFRGLPIWWDRAAFFKDFEKREIDLGNPIDANFVWLLSAAEASLWNEKCRREFSRDPRSSDPVVLEDICRWGLVLVHAAWVIVESYEWESGLE